MSAPLTKDEEAGLREACARGWGHPQYLGPLLATLDAERARAARTEALYAGAYALLCEFDVYGTGGDVSACAREVKQRLMEATQALDAERAKVARLREGLEHAAKSLESASAHYKVDDDNVRAYCLSRATVARTVLRETGGEP